MSARELSNRYSIEREAGSALETRIGEYSMSKIDLTIEFCIWPSILFGE